MSPGSSPDAKSPVFVFDTATHRFLGTNAGAVVVQAFVDQAGQRP